MFIARHHFRLATGREDALVQICRERDSRLQDVPGRRRFHRLHFALDLGPPKFEGYEMVLQPVSPPLRRARGSAIIAPRRVCDP
jgi:hypothetical protein